MNKSFYVSCITLQVTKNPLTQKMLSLQVNTDYKVITNKTYFTVSVKYEARITYPRNKEFLNTGLKDFSFFLLK